MLGRFNGSDRYTFVAASMPVDENMASFTKDELGTCYIFYFILFALSLSHSCAAPTHGKAVPFWSNYVRGIVAQFENVPGFDAVIVSNVNRPFELVSLMAFLHSIYLTEDKKY